MQNENKETYKTGDPIVGIDVLNAGLGHMEVRFNKDDPMEIARAQRIIGDMLKRGYALFIQGEDKVMLRVEKFDPKTDCYIIADGPEVPNDTSDQTEPVEHIELPAGKRAVKRGKTLVTAVGRSAGG